MKTNKYRSGYKIWLLVVLVFLFLILPLVAHCQTIDINWTAGIAGNEIYHNKQTKAHHWKKNGDMVGNDNTGEKGSEFSYLRTDFLHYQLSRLNVQFDYWCNNESGGLETGLDAEALQYSTDSGKTWVTLPVTGDLNKLQNDIIWHHANFEIDGCKWLAFRFLYDTHDITWNSYDHNGQQGFWFKNFRIIQLLDTGTALCVDTVAYKKLHHKPIPDTIKTTVFYNGSGITIQPYQLFTICDELGRKVKFEKPGIYFIITAEQRFKIFKTF